jgi:DNA-binding LacI/PurR family transcriptional regulator
VDCVEEDLGMAVTIKDVAKMANVSPSTVSRVIANNPRISEKTKRRVRESMKQLGYHPNFHARSLANKSTDAIGVIMPSAAHNVLQNPFFPEVLRGISTKAYENRYGLYLSTGTTEEEIFEEVVAMVQGRRVDGIVVLYSRVNDKVMTYLEEEGFPFTVIGKPYHNSERITHVDNDNFNISKEVTETFIQSGHTSIAFIGGDLDFVVSADRKLGYEQALKEKNLSINEEYIILDNQLKDGGRDAVKKLLNLDERPTALIVGDDVLAFDLISKLFEVGIHVPNDMSIVSFGRIFKPTVNIC